MESVGVDLGFYQVKLSKKEVDYKFPSVIGYPSSVELQNDIKDLPPEKNISIVDEGHYYIGEKAIRDTRSSQLTFVSDKTDNKTDRLKYLAALGLASGSRANKEFHIVTGLPVDEFAGVGGLKEKLSQNMQGDFFYIYNDNHIKVTVPKVTVIPQSAGAYYDHILDMDGGLIQKRVKPKTLVIDIGYRTTDVVTMVNAKYSPTESFTILTGVSDSHKEMKRNLLRHYKLNKDLTEIDEIIRSGSIYLGGRQESISSLKEQSIQPYAEKILSTIPLYIQNIADIHEILVTGGGANLMIDYVLQEYASQVPVTHMDQSEYSNARGYYKYAEFLKQNGRE